MPARHHSQRWLLEQQLRAEVEADTWRRLHAAAVAQTAVARPSVEGGSVTLKALVRFAIGAFGAYLGWLAAIDSQLGSFEIWLATGAGFMLALALTLLDPFRRMVHLASEAARFCIVAGLALGAVWLLVQGPSL